MIVGVDIGRSAVKVCYLTNTFSFPHLIGEGRDITQVDTIDRPKIQSLDNLDITYYNKRYFIGKKAKESYCATPVFQKSLLHENTIVLLLAALSQIESSTFDIVIGLPIADFRSQRKELSNDLHGRFTFDVSGESRTILIRNVSVYPQGVGALLSMYLSHNGSQLKELPEMVGIVDIGWKDCNFAVLQDGEFVDKLSYSYPVGLHEAFLAATKELNNDATIDQISYNDIPKHIYQQLQTKIQSIINPYWKGHKFPIYCSGGGSYHINIGEQLENPVFANAIGFKKLGVLKYA